jgi:hypothetical protein
MYGYVSAEKRDEILSARMVAAKLPLGEGGEVYIGSSYWCYNCASEGHLGDVNLQSR